eukprot:TRINITY_DN17857_c0_g1_i1.p1 TRINITY_DN17857_c0_g1~~TRINITY_DN17857_c0_g1_i1.p1  ORF type:complete len:574 (+),score=180.41 TRINITY_DN17857_c0_g1_i1:362-2083(+)
MLKRRVACVCVCVCVCVLCSCFEWLRCVDGIDLDRKKEDQKFDQVRSAITRVNDRLDTLQEGSGSRDFYEQLKRVQSSFSTTFMKSVEKLEGDILTVQQAIAKCNGHITETDTHVEALTAQVRQQGLHSRGEDSKAVQQLQQRLDEVHDAFASTEKATQKTRDSVKSLEAKMASADESASSLRGLLQQLERSTTGEASQLVGTVSKLQLQVAQLQKAVDENGGSDQIHQFKGAIVNMQTQIASVKQDIDAKASLGDMHSLKSIVTGLSTSVGSTRTQVGESSETGRHLQHVRDEVTNLISKVASLDAALQQKAEAKELVLMKDCIDASAKAAPFEAEKVQHLEQSLNSFKRELAALERALQSKASIEQMPVFRGAFSQQAAGERSSGVMSVQQQQLVADLQVKISNVLPRVAELEKAVDEKGSATMVLACKKSIAKVDGRVNEVLTAMQDKVDCSIMQHVKSSLGSTQTRVDAVESSLHQSATADDVRELRNSVANVRAEISSLEQVMNDKTDIQKVKANFLFLESKVAGLQNALQEKASGSQVFELREGLGKLQATVASTLRERSSPMLLLH